MKAYVFSIGEKTTQLCVDLLDEMGFEVILFQDKSPLCSKLQRFYDAALKTEDNKWLRIDADIIPNKNVKRLPEVNQAFGDDLPSWICASGFDWYKQDRGAISIHVMNREAVERAQRHCPQAKEAIRPETYIWRQPDLNPFTMVVESFNAGLHGYGQANQRKRIQELKESRNQVYDWKLLERIEALK